MRSSHLKALRVGLALIFFILTLLVFLDVHNLIAPSFARRLFALQFVPSLLQYRGNAVAGAAGWIAIVLLTVLCGRIYCSTLCPLGTLQDVVGFLAGKRRRRSFHFTKPHNVLRYSLLALTALLLLAGSAILLNFLDPFSSFGRIAANLVRPFVLFLNNLAAATLEQWEVYALPRLRWPVPVSVAVGLSLTTLLLIALLAASRGRLYCNTVCPVGALLGLLASISWLRLGIDPKRCKGCTACEEVCKAGCIDSRRKTVDSSRCVGCCNCLAACQRNCLRFENRWRWRRPPQRVQPDRQRRGFFVNSAVFFLGLADAPEPTRVIVQSKPTTIAEQVTWPAVPPGAGSIAHFTATCTACHLCVSACPSRVLVPSLFEFGLAGIMQPRMRFRTGHCNYECTICLEVCPSGAILPLELEEKKLTQLGVAKFIKENCVVFTDNTACGACSEHCPTKAVDMVPYANPANKDLKIPEMRPDYCIGCGGCEHACPTRPYRAIFVDGNPQHKLAKKPVVKKIEDTIDPGEDFPF